MGWDYVYVTCDSLAIIPTLWLNFINSSRQCEEEIRNIKIFCAMPSTCMIQIDASFVGRAKDLQQKTSGFINNSVCQDLYVKSQSKNRFAFFNGWNISRCGYMKLTLLRGFF